MAYRLSTMINPSANSNTSKSFTRWALDFTFNELIKAVSRFMLSLIPLDKGVFRALLFGRGNLTTWVGKLNCSRTWVFLSLWRVY